MAGKKGKDRTKVAQGRSMPAPQPEAGPGTPPMPRSVSLPVRPKGRVKAWSTLGLLVLGTAVPYFVPGLETYRPLARAEIESTFLGPWHGRARVQLLAWKEVLSPLPRP